MNLFQASDKAVKEPGQVTGLRDRVGYWLNIYDPADVLSFKCAPVFADVNDDLPYLGGSSSFKAHGELLRAEELLRARGRQAEAGVPMTLILDRRAELGDRPGTHAFLWASAGTPTCPARTGTDDLPARQTLGLRQLTVAVTTVYRIYRWLVERQAYLPAQLTTCRLLLAPSDVELAMEPKIADGAGGCTLERHAASAPEACRGDELGVGAAMHGGASAASSHEER